MARTDIDIPFNGWKPRPHQRKLWRYLQRDGKRAMAVWHRRAGKDEVCLHHTAVAMIERVGNYWHCLPEFLQGRKAIWTAINAHTGRRRIDEAFPQQLRANTNDHDMFIRLHNGSTWQVIGSDRYDATVGAGVAGIVYSEWALANPSAWAYHRPMLEENNGWATFITTPRGRNHAFAMFQHAAATRGEWFCELLTAKQTGALTDAALATALKEYTALYGRDVGQAQYDQEYFCSFNAAILGAYFALEMAQVRAEERIIAVSAERAPVHRAWDLGVRDDTSIWWFQVVGGQILILDHYASSGAGVEHYAERIEERRKQHGWIDGTDFVPHDAKILEWGSGRLRIDSMRLAGLHPMLVPRATFQDSIEAARRTLPLCIFHPRTEETGIAALEQYRREWDDEKKAFKATDVHDWTAHPAASFRYLSLAWQYMPKAEAEEPAILQGQQGGGWTIPPPPEDKKGMRL